MIKIKLLILLMFAVVGGIYWQWHKSVQPVTQTPVSKISTASPAQPPVNHCANNSAAKSVIVSVSARHMWACESSSQKYDSAVVTGYEGYPETLTPRGTYKISGKLLNQPLVGSDRLGSWNVHVDYWLPFLTNQYGNYGFHDATWRADSAFGGTDPSSKEASHGCVELPLTAMKWLYDWSSIGTVITVES